MIKLVMNIFQPYPYNFLERPLKNRDLVAISMSKT